MKTHSTSQTFKGEKTTKQATELEIDRISACKCNDNWWLSLVLEVDIENSEIKVLFLHPRGPAHSSTIPDILTVPLR